MAISSRRQLPASPRARSALRRAGLLTTAFTLVIGASLAAAPVAFAAPGDGSAYGASVSVTLLGGSPIVVGPLATATTSGPTTATLASVTVPGVLTTGIMATAASFNATTGEVTSSASTANVGLPLLSGLGAVSAQAIAATCDATASGTTGTSTLTNATLGSLGSLAVNPAPNTVIAINIATVHVATLVLNEQISNPDGSLTVNAFHLTLLGGVLGSLGVGDVIISSATCGPAVPVAAVSAVSFSVMPLVLVGLGVLILAGFAARAWYTRMRRSEA